MPKCGLKIAPPTLGTGSAIAFQNAHWTNWNAWPTGTLMLSASGDHADAGPPIVGGGFAVCNRFNNAVQYDFDSETDTRPECGLHGVAVAILQRAVEDYRYGKPRQREDARVFFGGGWFVALAEGCRLDVEAVRERLRCNETG